jgi:hypothetical protein
LASINVKNGDSPDTFYLEAQLDMEGRDHLTHASLANDQATFQPSGALDSRIRKNSRYYIQDPKTGGWRQVSGNTLLTVVRKNESAYCFTNHAQESSAMGNEVNHIGLHIKLLEYDRALGMGPGWIRTNVDEVKIVARWSFLTTNTGTNAEAKTANLTLVITPTWSKSFRNAADFGSVYPYLNIAYGFGNTIASDFLNGMISDMALPMVRSAIPAIDYLGPIANALAGELTQADIMSNPVYSAIAALPTFAPGRIPSSKIETTIPLPDEVTNTAGGILDTLTGIASKLLPFATTAIPIIASIL